MLLIQQFQPSTTHQHTKSRAALAKLFDCHITSKRCSFCCNGMPKELAARRLQVCVVHWRGRMV